LAWHATLFARTARFALVSAPMRGDKCTRIAATACVAQHAQKMAYRAALVTQSRSQALGIIIAQQMARRAFCAAHERRHRNAKSW